MLDIERPDELLSYLCATGRILPLEVPCITVLAGGVSNRTVLVERPTGEAWVLKQALAKLRVAVDWFSSPERIEREALGLKHLIELAPEGATTPLVFQDLELHLLAMRAVPRPHENWKTMLLAGQIIPDHVRQFGDVVGTIHRRASERSDLFAAVFADRSFFESLRLEPYYHYAATQVPQAADFLQNLIATTRQRPFTLVHGDYSPKNILVRDGRLILLDHEVIHWGDPAFDVGFALTHLLSKAHHLPEHRHAFGDAAKLFWQTYRSQLAESNITRDLEPMAVRHTLGCLLARVAGRSPLEYLDSNERRRQETLVVRLIGEELTDPLTLIERWIRILSDHS